MPKFFEAILAAACGPLDQGEKISFKPALAQPEETTTSKNKTGTD